MTTKPGLSFHLIALYIYIYIDIIDYIGNSATENNVSQVYIYTYIMNRATQKVLELYNKWIAAGGDYFEGG